MNNVLHRTVIDSRSLPISKANLFVIPSIKYIDQTHHHLEGEMGGTVVNTCMRPIARRR